MVEFIIYSSILALIAYLLFFKRKFDTYFQPQNATFLY